MPHNYSNNDLPLSIVPIGTNTDRTCFSVE